MATTAEIARFFCLGLRAGLLNTAAVEKWADSVIAAESIATYPFTELAVAANRRPEDVDNLLSQVAGGGNSYTPGYMILALIRRQLNDGTLTQESALKLALEISQGDLPSPEYDRANELDDSLSLAKSGTYGDVETVRREITDYLDHYAKFEEQIPTST